ncbi:DUF6221 family protein [Streptomyces sp. NPDC058619]|uniref:DUF6221 family protein n=1 Tax=Streptomyces sp. NPDC058619 TaxID=3346559 RepID=UPI0036551A68
MDDLVQFLRDRYDEDVVEAGKLADGDDWEMEPWQVRRDETGTYDSYAYLRIAKARVLAEVVAKRQLLDEHGDTNDGSCGTCVDGQWGYPVLGSSTPQPHPCRTLRLLALPYANHPDYREDWRPAGG